MPAASATSAQPAPARSQPRAASSDQAPGPAPARANAAATRTRLYSKPLFVFQIPLRACTVTTAVVITATIAAEPSGVSRPRARSSPPPSSAQPATTACIRAGRSPMRSKPSAVPSRPLPPNAPNSFCAPWPMKRSPTTSRSASSARFIPALLAAWLASLSFFPLIRGRIGLDGEADPVYRSRPNVCPGAQRGRRRKERES